MFELDSQSSRERPDGLFLERLDAFCLAEMKAFSEREHRSFEETRQHIAEWHSKFLFQPSAVSVLGTTSENDRERLARVRSVLCDISRMLESLYDASGVQSFLLAVDPHYDNAVDSGAFLGGSIHGREFWRGLRGGGEAGAKAFKLHCTKHVELSLNSDEDTASSGKTSQTPSSKTLPARSLKTELYESVRKALRSVSGVRNAEMKWSNHERLDIYGVTLVGWPSDIPVQNPSALKLHQNKQLLEALENGTMRFEKVVSSMSTSNCNPRTETPPADDMPPPPEDLETDSFSWAIQYEGSTSSNHQGQTVRTQEPSILVWDSGQRPRKRPRRNVEDNAGPT